MLEPGRDLVADGLARAGSLLDVGRPAEALTVMSALPPDPDVCFMRASAFYQLGEFTQAESQARAGLAGQPEHPWGLVLFGEIALARGQSREALDSAQAAMAAAGPFTEALIVLSAAQRVQGQAAAAVLSAQQAVELAPLLPASHVALSRAYSAAGDPMNAETSARQAVATDPQDQDALACLAGVLEGTYRFTEAQTVRLLAAGARPDQTRVDALGQVASVALAAVLVLNAAIPLIISTQDHSSAATGLAAAVLSDALCSGAYIGLRYLLQRRMSGLQRRGVRHVRRWQDRALLLSAALPFPPLLIWWTWQGARTGSGWGAVVAAVVVLGVALTVAHRIQPIRIPHADLGRLWAGLRRELRWGAFRTRAEQDRDAAAPARAKPGCAVSGAPDVPAQRPVHQPFDRPWVSGPVGPGGAGRRGRARLPAPLHSHRRCADRPDLASACGPVRGSSPPDPGPPEGRRRPHRPGSVGCPLRVARTHEAGPVPIRASPRRAAPPRARPRPARPTDTHNGDAPALIWRPEGPAHQTETDSPVQSTLDSVSAVGVPAGQGVFPILVGTEFPSGVTIIEL